MKKNFTLFILLSFFGLCSGVNAQSPCDEVNAPSNLIVNGSFEDDLTGWNWSGGELEPGSDFVTCGLFNASFNYIGGSPAIAWQEIHGLSSGAALTLKCELGIYELGQTCSPRVSLSFYNSGRTLISTVSENITNNVELPPNLLSQYVLSAVVPPGTAYTSVEITTNCDRVKMENFILVQTALVLPVRLTNFSGVLRNGASELNWTTVSEENIAHYGVEYSTNGNDFSPVGTVNSRGNSSTPMQYQFRHALAQPGKNYYRLKITDRIGQITHSSIALVDVPVAALAGVRIAPNPFVGKLEFRFYTEDRQNLVIRLVNQQGKTVLSENYMAGKGAHLYALNNLEKLPAGMYMAEIVAASGKRLMATMLVK